MSDDFLFRVSFGFLCLLVPVALAFLGAWLIGQAPDTATPPEEQKP